MRIHHIILAVGLTLSLTGCETVRGVVDKSGQFFNRTFNSLSNEFTRRAVAEKPVVPSAADFSDEAEKPMPAPSKPSTTSPLPAKEKTSPTPTPTKTKEKTSPSPAKVKEKAVSTPAKAQTAPTKEKSKDNAKEKAKSTPVPASTISATPTPEPAAPEEPTEAAKALARELTGEWQIVAVGSDKIELEDDMPYIVFDARNGKFYANNGCNVINGQFATGIEPTITFSKVLTSLRYCPNDIFGSAISALLADGVTVTARFKRQGHDSYIYLHDVASKMSLTLRCHNMNFLNGNWQVVSINGNHIHDDEATIFFDIPQLKLHGNTGCNFFNGSIYIDPTHSNAIDFSQMSVTRMNCPKTKQETAMLVALEQTTSAIEDKDGLVILLDAGGNNLMELKRIKQ